VRKIIRTILIYEADMNKREKLEKCIRAHLRAMGLLHIQFRNYTPRDVFNMTDSDMAAAWAAFITLDRQHDADAAEMFGKTYRDIPMIVVSDTAEYGLASWSWGTRFYLKRPFDNDEMQAALAKCF
jgi:hypothetical protein